MDEVLSHLRGRQVAGRRIVVQEHGLSLDMSAQALRVEGADVDIVSVYRCEPAGDLAPVFKLVEQIADRELDAVTFTSAPAVTTLMAVAAASGRRERVVDAFHDGVLATCVGPVTAAAFEPWGVPTVQPERARLGPMVRALEDELRKRNEGTAITVAGRRMLLRGGSVLRRRPRDPALRRAALGAPDGADRPPRRRAVAQAADGRTCPAARPAASTPSRWPSRGSAARSGRGSCRPWSSAATGCRPHDRPSSRRRRARHPQPGGPGDDRGPDGAGTSPAAAGRGAHVVRRAQRAARSPT